jgi:hypothetical protein
MKRAILAFLASLMVFGTVFGFAAALGVDAGNLQSGGDTDLDCDNEIQVHWNVEWSNSEGDWTVHNVNIGGLNSACNGEDIIVVLTAENGNFIEDEITCNVVDTDPPSVDFGGSATVEEVFDVHVAIGAFC